MGSAGGSKQESYNQQSSQTYVDPIQQGFLQNLYGSAQAQANPGEGRRYGAMASRQNAPFLAQGMNVLGRLADPTSQIAAQQESLQAGLGQLFTEELNPALESNAIAAGGFGGGRQGVAQGQAVGQLGQAYTQGLGDIVARANAQAASAASLMPQLAQAQAANALLPQTAALDPLERLAGILGGPTVLAKSQGVGGGSREAFDVGFGKLFG